jgi:hypothetical protein
MGVNPVRFAVAASGAVAVARTVIVDGRVRTETRDPVIVTETRTVQRAAPAAAKPKPDPKPKPPGADDGGGDAG